MDWVKELKHYQVNAIDDIKDDELLEEAIATCESYFKNMYEDEELKYKLINRSRPLVIAYLSLKHQEENKKSGLNRDDIIINSIDKINSITKVISNSKCEIKIIGVKITFSYKEIKNATIEMETVEVPSIEMIKDKIIEVING